MNRNVWRQHNIGPIKSDKLILNGFRSSKIKTFSLLEGKNNREENVPVGGALRCAAVRRASQEHL